MSFDDIQGIIRHVLTGLGGGLIAQGALTSDDLNSIVGGVVTLIGVIWSLYNKRQHRQALAAATQGK